jgi:hypothetical protein
MLCNTMDVPFLVARQQIYFRQVVNADAALAAMLEVAARRARSNACIHSQIVLISKTQPTRAFFSICFMRPT